MLQTNTQRVHGLFCTFSDTLISQKLRRLQVMDGIFTVEQLHRPEQLEEGVLIQLVVTGKDDVAAATASRPLLQMLEHALGQDQT